MNEISKKNIGLKKINNFKTIGRSLKKRQLNFIKIFNNSAKRVFKAADI